MAEHKLTFEEALAKYVASLAKHMEYARIASELALEQVVKGDNRNWVQALYAAIPKNYGRRDAFVKWVCEHTPTVLENMKFKKDTRPGACKNNLEKAMQKPFWDYKPMKEIVNFDTGTFMKALWAVFKRFENGETHRGDVLANERIAQLKAVLQQKTAKGADNPA